MERSKRKRPEGADDDWPRQKSIRPLCLVEPMLNIVMIDDDSFIQFLLLGQPCSELGQNTEPHKVY